MPRSAWWLHTTLRCPCDAVGRQDNGRFLEKHKHAETRRREIRQPDHMLNVGDHSVVRQSRLPVIFFTSRERRNVPICPDVVLRHSGVDSNECG